MKKMFIRITAEVDEKVIETTAEQTAATIRHALKESGLDEPLVKITVEAVGEEPCCTT